MSRPTEQELETALHAAVFMREHDDDQYHLAKSLLNHNYRIHAMEKVIEKAKLYLHSGQNTHLEWDLEKAITEAENASKPINSDDENMHLW